MIRRGRLTRRTVDGDTVLDGRRQVLGHRWICRSSCHTQSQQGKSLDQVKQSVVQHDDRGTDAVPVDDELDRDEKNRKPSGLGLKGNIMGNPSVYHNFLP